MDPDQYQRAWRAQSSQTRVTIDADLLLKQVQRGQQVLRAATFFGDFGVIGILLLLLPVWIYMGMTAALPWTWYLMVPADIWIIGFILVGRARQKRKPSESGEPLLKSVKESLALVERQIWLSRKTLWWYLLPTLIPMLLFFAHVAWQLGIETNQWLVALAFGTFLFVFALAVYASVYYIIQRGVRKHHEPRRQELLALLSSLSDETATEVSGEYPFLMSEKPITSRRMWVACLLFMAILLLVIAGILVLFHLAARVHDQTAGAMTSSSYGVPPRRSGPASESLAKLITEQGKEKKLVGLAAMVMVDGHEIWRIFQKVFSLVSLFQIFLTMLFYYVFRYVIRRLMDRRRARPSKWKAGLMRQIMWALFGAALCPVIWWPPSVTPTLDLVAKLAVIGAASALIFCNAEALVLRLPSVLFRVLARSLGLHRAYPDYDGAASSDGPSGDWLAGLVSELRKQKKLVGLAARVVVDGQVVASAADGERKRGSGVPIGLGDRWHLGSITKSITATMIARLVESGKMQWSDSVGGRFTDLSIYEDWKPVTLRQLLTHTAGAPRNFSLRVRLIRPALGPECTRERRQAVMNVIARKPAHRPGKKCAYSNVGYTIAGAMAETVTGVSWEDLVKREVFEPLELTGAGFGPPKSSPQTLDQPRGHRGILDWKTSASDSDEEDNTPIMGPAGTVHMTLSDLCMYAGEHLRGELGTGKLLASETYKRLHTPELDNYACGWVKRDPTYEFPYTAYWHNGSNTMWYALVVFVPEKNMTVAVTANDGDIGRAESAAWALVEQAYDRCCKQGGHRVRWR
jgi:CubicO group peptidase (beta-lactamase class C family)